MSAADLTLEARVRLGQKCRAEITNPLIQAFAAELIDESYPLSPAMCLIVFKSFEDADLGTKLAEWIDERDRRGVG